MNFNLKQPCGNCLFKTKGAIELRPGRLEGIARDLHSDDSVHFPCHKFQGASRDRPICMGAVAYAYKAQCLPVGARIAIAFNIVTIEQLRSIGKSIIEPMDLEQKPTRRRVASKSK